MNGTITGCLISFQCSSWSGKLKTATLGSNQLRLLIGPMTFFISMSTSPGSREKMSTLSWRRIFFVLKSSTKEVNGLNEDLLISFFPSHLIFPPFDQHMMAIL